MKKRYSILIIFVFIIIFTVSVYKIINLRFTKGDVYFKYSSLRNDPIGTSIFFQSLKKMGFKVDILTEEWITEETDQENSIVFYLSPSLPFTEESTNQIIDFIKGGGRVLLTAPLFNNRIMEYFNTRLEKKANIKLEEYDPNIEKGKGGFVKAIRSEKYHFLEGEFPLSNIHSLDCSWPKALTIYSTRDQDVMLILTHGKGEIIICSDTYFISNENSINNPPVILLNWIVEGRKHIIVDEYHHGIMHYKGVSFLIKKYNLYWFMFYLLLIFSLYLWHIIPSFRKPLTSFVKNGESLTTIKGYAYLLKEAIPKNRLLDICVQQWLKGGKGRFAKVKDEKYMDIIKTKASFSKQIRQEEIVWKYNEISEVINNSQFNDFF